MDLDSSVLRDYGHMLVGIGEEMLRIANVADEAVASPAPIASAPTPQTTTASMRDELRLTDTSAWARRWGIDTVYYLSPKRNYQVLIESARRAAREGKRVYLVPDDVNDNRGWILDPSDPEMEIQYAG